MRGFRMRGLSGVFEEGFLRRGFRMRGFRMRGFRMRGFGTKKSRGRNKFGTFV
jgi:hypothetical protein